MKTAYLELLFQHKFTIVHDIKKESIIQTFPSGTSDYDVHNARLKMYETQRDDIQKLIDAYIYHHSKE